MKSLLFLFLLSFSFSVHGWNTSLIQQAGGNKYTNFTWTGAAAPDTSWSNPANWCGAFVNGACQGATSAPGSGSNVVFNDICGANCNVTLTANAAALSITIQSSYTGTISQGSFTMSVGHRGFTQRNGTWRVQTGTFNTGVNNWATLPTLFAGGTFDGGSGTINLGPTAFSNDGPTVISGGTFIASTGTTTFRGQPTTFGAGATFTNSGGTVQFNASSTGGGNRVITVPSSTIFNHVNFVNLGGTASWTIAGTLTMDGNLLLDGSTVAGNNLNGGAINVREGDVTRIGRNIGGTTQVQFTDDGMQTIDSSGVVAGQTQFPGISISQPSTGSVRLIGDITFTGGFVTPSNLGGFDQNGATVAFNLTNASTWDPGTGAVLSSLTINGSPNTTVIGAVYVTGNLTISSTSGSSTSTAGIVYVGGDILFTTGAFLLTRTVLELNGTGAQNINSSGSTLATLPGVRINKASGAVTFTGTPNIWSSWQFTTVGTGSITMPATFQFGSHLDAANNLSVSSGGIPFNNVRVVNSASSGSPGMTLTDTMVVSGSLYMSMHINLAGAYGLSGTMEVYGNISTGTDSAGGHSSGFSVGGTGSVVLRGTSQVIDFTASTGYPTMASINLNSAGGTTTLLGTVSLRDYTYTAGALSATASTVRFNRVNRTITTGGTASQFGNVEMTENNLTFTGGNLIVNGNLTITAQGSYSGTVDVYGNVTQSGTGPSGSFALRFLGNNSTWSRTTPTNFSGLTTIAKTAGQTVTLLSNVTLGGPMSITSGSVDIGSPLNTLSIPGAGSLTLAATTKVIKSGGTLLVNSVSVPNGAYSGGTIDP